MKLKNASRVGMTFSLIRKESGTSQQTVPITTYTAQLFLHTELFPKYMR
jgi:hypothetical protein